MDKKDQPKYFAIEAPSLQELINYLTTKPYSEVYKLMSMLVKLPPVNIVSMPEPKGDVGNGE